MNTMIPDYTVQISTPDQFTHPEDKIEHPGHTWHGAAILWHESLNSHTSSIQNIHSRFTAIKIALGEHSVLAISAYLPTSGKDTEYLDCLGELSTFITANNTENATIIIGMDSNCSENSTQRRTNSMGHFCEDHSLLKVAAPGPTFHHSNGVSSSNIDYYLVSQNSTANISNISSQCTQDHPQNLSSHDLVIAKFTLPSSEIRNKNSKHSHTFSEFKETRVVWPQEPSPEYQQLADQALTNFEQYFPTPEFLPLKCQLYSDLLVRAGELSLKIKPVRSAKKACPTPQLHHAWKHLHKCYKLWKYQGKPRDHCSISFLQYKTSRANFQQIRRYQDNQKMIKMNNPLMHLNKCDKTEYFKLIRRLQGQPQKQPLKELHTPTGVYYGQDTLEGFANDAELLAKHVGESKEYDNEFYRLCIQDNQFIFDFQKDNCMRIPEMKIEDLEKIINTEMKNGKSCDIYRLTAEHLKHCGPVAKNVLLRLINSILSEIYFLSCPQVKAGLGTAVFKGKKKSPFLSSSYRRITVTPQIGSIIDRYLDPIAEAIFRPVQNSEQYGFTKGVSYLVAAVLRGECQRWALDTKQTCFGVSFDGKAAFPSVDREIQVRELFSCGETGDILKYSKYTYENTVCRMKKDGKLSREIREFKGACQGHKKASGHFKTYINPCLSTANSSELGFSIGPICISAVCIADDTYVLSNDPRKLQALINIIAHYGRRYRLIFGAEKTKVTVTGSKHDMRYYQDINIWSLYGEKIKVSEDNDHLGLVVSGVDEELKNVDKNIKTARDTLFSFLGNIFSYKCKLSASLQYHTWQVYIKPILCTGLSALPL